MSEKQIYLESNHEYNFRHDVENPLVIGFVMYKPKGFHERPCFKVLYESDNTVDYISYECIKNGQWLII